ncbi:MAG: DMT family transporter [Rhodospirillales bacterium]
MSDSLAGSAGGLNAGSAAHSRWQQIPPNLRGALLVTIAAIGFTLVWTLAKMLAERGMHPYQISLCRAVFSLIVLAPFVVRGGTRAFQTRHPWLHFTRALAGAVAMLFGFYALVRLPLAEVTALGFTTPLFTVLFAALVLRETVGWRRWAAVGAGFAGMLIIVQPGAAAFSSDALFAIGSAMLIAFAITLVKRFPASESQTILLLYVLVASILVCLLPALAVWRDPTPLEWAMLAGIGIMGLGAHALFISGFRTGESSFVAPFDYSKLLFAGVIGFFAFGELPGLHTLAGALVLIGSTVYIAQREARLARAGRKAKRTPPPEG